MVLSATRATHNSKLQQMVSAFRLDVQIARPPYTPSPQLNSESLCVRGQGLGFSMRVAALMLQVAAASANRASVAKAVV